MLRTCVRGGGYSQKILVGVCDPLPKTLTLFMTKICDFPYPIYDLAKKLYTLFMTWLFLLLALSRLYQALNEVMEDNARMGEEGCDEEVASSKRETKFKTRVRKLDTLFMTKMAGKWLKSIPNLWPKRLKNHTLWDRTYLYSPYKGVPPGVIWSRVREANPWDNFIERLYVKKVSSQAESKLTLCDYP